MGIVVIADIYRHIVLPLACLHFHLMLINDYFFSGTSVAPRVARIGFVAVIVPRANVEVDNALALLLIGNVIPMFAGIVGLGKNFSLYCKCPCISLGNFILLFLI